MVYATLFGTGYVLLGTTFIGLGCLFVAGAAALGLWWDLRRTEHAAVFEPMGDG
jgi:hypothetical protein